MNNTVWSLIDELQEKKGINEIIINNADHIFVERDGEFIKLNAVIKKEDIINFCQDVAKINNDILNTEHPILDGNLKDGSRINIIYPPYAVGSPAITIRKYIKTIASFEKDPEVFGLKDEGVNFLKAIVLGKLNIIVSGGTGVGKTTLLNLLLNEVLPSERLVIIEDTIEISNRLPNCVRLEAVSKKGVAGPSLRDLVKNTLRMRPDRVIIGEVRSGEMFDLLQAMNTGHEGSMTSIHASSPRESFSRMENLVLMSGIDVPIPVIRRQIAQGIDILIQLCRDRENKRVIERITEITGMEGDQILTQVLFQREEGVLKQTGMASTYFERLQKNGGLNKDFFNI